MPKVDEMEPSHFAGFSGKLRVRVIIAARNEEKNLPRCLEMLPDVGEVYVIDSQSEDATAEIVLYHRLTFAHLSEALLINLRLDMQDLRPLV